MSIDIAMMRTSLSSMHSNPTKEIMIIVWSYPSCAYSRTIPTNNVVFQKTVNRRLRIELVIQVMLRIMQISVIVKLRQLYAMLNCNCNGNKLLNLNY
jgi:hypothetical protein